MGTNSGRRAEPRPHIAGTVAIKHEFALLPAVKNGYNDNYVGNDLFDLSHADVGQPTPNFVSLIRNDMIAGAFGLRSLLPAPCPLL